MNLSDVRIDPELEKKLPKLRDEEFIGLERDIVKYKGRTDRDPLDDPIHVWAKGNYIIDGHNRYRILIANKMETKNFTVHDEFENKSDVIKWMYDHQAHRRNLTIEQQLTWAMQYEKEIAKEAKERQKQAGGDRKSDAYKESLSSNLNEPIDGIRTAAEAAKMVGMSENSYRDGKLILEKGSEEKIERMNKGGRGNKVSSIANEVREGIPDGKRKCRTCGLVKDLSEFKKSGKEGFATICKDCYNESQRAKKIKPMPVAQPEEEPVKEKVVSEEVDDDIKAFIKKSYAPDDYYDTTTKPEKNIQDAIAQLNIIFKDTKTKIMFVLKRYEDILKSQRDRDEVGRYIKEFRVEIGSFEHNLMHTTHL